MIFFSILSSSRFGIARVFSLLVHCMFLLTDCFLLILYIIYHAELNPRVIRLLFILFVPCSMFSEFSLMMMMMRKVGRMMWKMGREGKGESYTDVEV